MEPSFTPRQHAVLLELCKGRTNKEIARSLGIAEATVKLHLTEIFKELGVANRQQAIVKASSVPATRPEPFVALTDLEILEEFTNTAFDSLGSTWSDRVLRFGHAVESRCRS